MIERIGFFTEILSILLCVHALYGKKFCLNIKNIITIGLDIMILQLIAEEKLTSEFSMLTWGIVILYCAAEFGFHKREIIVNTILYLVILSVLQIVAWEILEAFHMIQLSESGGGINNIMINTLVLVFILVIFPHLKLRKISIFMQQKIVLIEMLLIVIFLFVLYIIVILKTTNVLTPENYVVIIVSLCFIGSVTYMWQKNQYKVREQKMILQMHQLYGEGYQNLIEDVRRKQHDFQNHLNTIYSMHYTCNTYEELVEKQGNYVEAVQEDNKYSKLLKIGNPVMTGFVYGKFLHAEQRDILVDYDIKISNLDCRMPIHKMVQIIGNLFDNAMDAIEEKGVGKIIYLKFVESSKEIEFKIKNESDYIPQEKLIQMFQGGESSKGKNRGLGLVNVKQICEEYKCELQVENVKDEAQKNYIEFTISLKK